MAVQTFAFTHAPGMVVQSRDADEKRRRDFKNHHGFNHHQSELWASEQFNIFPNFNIHVALNGWWSMQYWPLAPGTAIWEKIGRASCRARECQCRSRWSPYE